MQKLLDTASGPVTYENEKAPKSQMGKPFIFLSFFLQSCAGKTKSFSPNRGTNRVFHAKARQFIRAKLVKSHIFYISEEKGDKFASAKT